MSVDEGGACGLLVVERKTFVVELRLKGIIVDGGRESGSHEGFIRPSGAMVGGWIKRVRWGRIRSLRARAVIHSLLPTRRTALPGQKPDAQCPRESARAGQLVGVEGRPWQAWETSLKEEEEIFQQEKIEGEGQNERLDEEAGAAFKGGPSRAGVSTRLRCTTTTQPG